LVQLLNQLADAASSRSAVQVEVHADADQGRLPPEVQVGLYRIAQESLNNVVKHSAANRVQVQFRREGSSVNLSIEDDGSGFDISATPPGHLGLSIMRERARAIGAHLTVETGIGSGTRIDLHWLERGS
jgi:signal transduction histidine kinase